MTAATTKARLRRSALCEDGRSDTGRTRALSAQGAIAARPGANGHQMEEAFIVRTRLVLALTVLFVAFAIVVPVYAQDAAAVAAAGHNEICLLYTSPSPRD